jgi:hypothetical protein
LHYNWHRHYDPSLGRYTQPDPLGFVDGPGVFAYARSNALRNIDPTGRDTDILTDPLIIGGAILICAAADYAWDKLKNLFKLPPKDDPDRCKKIINMCREKCLDIYEERPDDLPGEGSDMPGRQRRCIRECAESYGCYNF